MPTAASLAVLQFMARWFLMGWCSGKRMTTLCCARVVCLRARLALALPRSGVHPHSCWTSCHEMQATEAC